jgi:hypothetical protein
LRAIACVTAIGEVGSLAISSSITDTGWMISKPTRAMITPIVPTAIATIASTSGAERRPVRRAAASKASGKKSAPRIGKA